MYNSIVYLFVFLFFIVGCGNNSNKSFYYTKNGLKYEYHDIVTDGVKPQIGDFLNMYMTWSSLSDSVYYSSLNNQLFGIESFRLNNSSIDGGIHEGFLSIMEGDSVTFYVDPIDFYRYYLNDNPPYLISQNENIKISLRLLSVKDSVGQHQFKREQYLKLKSNEEFLIDELLHNWEFKYDSIFKLGDIYLVRLNKNFSKVERNQKETVRVFYSISLINGDVVFSNFSKEAFEFDMQSEYQMLDGFKYVVQQLNKGDHVMALVPSYLCFGAKWGMEQSIAPYSPLVFEIKMVD